MGYQVHATSVGQLCHGANFPEPRRKMIGTSHKMTREFKQTWAFNFFVRLDLTYIFISYHLVLEDMEEVVLRS